MENENRDYILNAIKYLSLRKKAPTRTEFLKEWDKGEQILDSELGALISDGLIGLSDETYFLSPEGRKLAQQNDARRFGAVMIACEQSPAYRELCRELYGNDLIQYDMMTQIQLEKLLDVLEVSKCKSILDVGCGLGTVTEYIAGHTDGNITGIDFSSEAIEIAQKRTKKKKNRLSFRVMDMDEIDFPSNSFDTIISIDTFYFVNDLYKTINALRGALQEQGQMGIFYSATISTGESKEMLRSENTVLAETLDKCGMHFETWEFTAEEKEFWKTSVNITNKLKNQFVDEGNLTIYNELIEEATGLLEYFDTERSRRYLFHAWL